MKTKVNEIDKHIGQKIKLRRIELGVSQKKLGDILGITYQQIQKYEWGTNRVSVGKLYKVAKILQTPINWFFDGIEDKDCWKSKALSFLKNDNKILRNDISKIGHNFQQIENKKTRRLIIMIVKHFVEMEKGMES